MRRDTQQSLESSRRSVTGLRAAVAGLTIFGASVVMGERPASSVAPEKPSLGSAEYALSLVSEVKSSLLDPRSAIAKAIIACQNLVSLEVHSPQDNPSMNIVDTRVAIRNATNPSEQVIVRADRQHNWDADRNDINTVVAGTNERSFMVFGQKTGEIECNNVRIFGVKDDQDCASGQKVPSTIIEGVQVDTENNPLKGYWSRAEVPCPTDKICKVRLTWVNDIPVPQAPAPVKETPKCPADTKMEGDVCVREVIKEVPVLVPGNPTIQQ